MKPNDPQFSARKKLIEALELSYGDDIDASSLTNDELLMLALAEVLNNI